MADSGIIADVGEALVKLFTAQMAGLIKSDQIGVVSSLEDNDLALSLFLYEVKPNPESQTYQMIHNEVSKFPAFALDLHYLIMANSSSSSNAVVNEHRIFGRAIQVLYDNPLLSDLFLPTSLATHNEPLRIMIQDNQSAQNLGYLFQHTRYKLSYNFTVGPIYLDSTREEKITRVAERVVHMKNRSEEDRS